MVANFGSGRGDISSKITNRSLATYVSRKGGEKERTARRYTCVRESERVCSRLSPTRVAFTASGRFTRPDPNPPGTEVEGPGGTEQVRELGTR